ncbi:MAG: hypothetical protein DRG39_06715 [Deltaproteobacteria bacterium]|nr:MAG: hypothetical protein DRG39_06715 [Deltaproteobacteria bacterium]
MSDFILGIGGSLRSKLRPQEVEAIVSNIKNREMLNYLVEKLSRDQKLSNSDLCLIIALYGVKEKGLNFRAVNLKKIFREGGKVKGISQFKKLLEDAKGLIISSPVYFGDRSSLIDDFIRFAKEHKLFEKKVVGCLSVGAKRNGGQETTNIYILKEVNDCGAYVVGNGPPTSQYGGTAWAGNIGSLREDEFGIMTSLGTGRKVAETVLLLQEPSSYPEKNIKISFWIMQDYIDKLENQIKEIIASLRDKLINVEWDVINFTKLKVKRCKACNICPWDKGKKNGEYKCKIKKDDFAFIYERIIHTNGIIVSAYYDTDKRAKSVYQKVLERVRQVRRDNFLLTNVPTTSLFMADDPTKSEDLFSLKVMTSFLRQNTILFPPLYISKGLEKDISKFEKFCRLVSYNRQFFKKSPQYLPIGYY